MTESDDKIVSAKIKGADSIEKLKKINTAANYCYNCNRCVNV
ncbi:hypothetical protein LCGC14_1501280, partial [marine sediment metagenome]